MIFYQNSKINSNVGDFMRGNGTLIALALISVLLYLSTLQD
ncbi:hypothetical protein BGS_1178 [Beggiatoa sp. SS]|nr:hypothetical protein BGS_1178 [Beggiatoa sp. SS]